MRDTDLVTDWLNRFRQDQMMRMAREDEEEQNKRAELFKMVELIKSEKAREAQMAQQAQQFAENLGFQREHAAETLQFQKERASKEDNYKNAMLELRKQGRTMQGEIGNKADPYTKEFEKTAAREEAKRISNTLQTTYSTDVKGKLQKIKDAEKALSQVTTGTTPASLTRSFHKATGLDTKTVSAYDSIEALAGEQWIKIAEDITGALSNSDREAIQKANFGMGLSNDTNKKLLEIVKRGYQNLEKFKPFVREYKEKYGTLKGIEDAWELKLNEIDSNNTNTGEQKKNDAQIASAINSNSSKKDFLSNLKQGIGEAPFRVGAGATQPFLDIGYGLFGKQAPQIIPEEERDFAYTLGDIGGNLLGWTGAAKGLGKAGLKSVLGKDVAAAAAIESAKDYEDRLGGGAKGAALGGIGYGIGKVAEKVIEPFVGGAKNLLAKGAKKTELAALAEEEGKLAGDVYDKVLGKYELRSNPSKQTTKEVRNKYEKLNEEFGKKYNELLRSTEKSDFRFPIKDLSEMTQELLKKSEYQNASKLTFKGMHDILSKLKEQKRVNKLQKSRGDTKSSFTLDLEEKLLSKDITKLNNLLKEKVPGYKELTNEYREEVVPYISNASLRNVVKLEKNPSNFATNLTNERDKGFKSLYNVLPQGIKETAVAGEFLKGRNVMEKNPREVGKLYQDLMKSGSQNARDTIEGQIGKETGEQLNKVSNEVRTITEELQKLNAINPNEDITRLVNYLSNGQVQKVSGIIEKLLETPLGTGAIKLLESLQKALKIGGKVTTPTLLSASKPNYEERYNQTN